MESEEKFLEDEFEAGTVGSNAWFDGVWPDAAGAVDGQTGMGEGSVVPDGSHSEPGDLDEAMIRLLATGMTYEQVGHQIGRSARTIRRRKSDPAFAARVAAARSERVEIAASRLTLLSDRAVSELEHALGDENPRVRLRAVELIFDIGAAARRSTDVEARISALEAGAEESA